jgi:phage-related minor tail protein
MTIVDPNPFDSGGVDELLPAIDQIQKSTSALGVSATQFANAMTKAFAQATTGGKEFDDVLKSMGLRLSNLAVTQAFKPIANGIAKSFNSLLSELFGPAVSGNPNGGGKGEDGTCSNCCCDRSQAGPSRGGPCFFSALGAIPTTPIVPFASGGVIGAPSYFPLMAGGVGLAGEAGPEAIMPLTRGAGGRLGVAMNGGGTAANVTVQIATPDAASFRRSEAYLTGQIARAVARGQRSL